MARLFIMRERSLSGMTLQLNCYVNNKFICKLKSGSDYTYQTNENIIEFKCNLPDSPVSDPIYMDLSSKALVTIGITTTGGKPQVKVYDSNVVISKPVGNKPSPVEPFSPTTVVGRYFAVDDVSHQWMVGKGFFSPFEKSVPYQFHDLVSFELLEDGSSLSKGGLGSAVMGGILFGHTGAVVGSITGKKKVKQTCTNLEIKITVKDASRPAEYIKLISSSTLRESSAYKSAYKDVQDILSLLHLIHTHRDSAPANTATPDRPQPTTPVDEIRKYKQLMDEGIISEEDFLAKKKQLLGL